MSDAPDIRRTPLRLFEGYGVEIEYVIADRVTLDVKPVSDAVIHAMAGGYVNDVEPDGPGGVIGYSNELALHVFELKTIDPAPTLDGLADRFAEHVRRINARLETFDALLLPTAMHPWMDPHTELKLWPHDYGPVYEAFNRIFDCRGHGWANLQSTHLNLPFHGDDEFGRLHAAIRLVLPLLPALAASSPIMDGRCTGTADNRLAVYRTNAQRVPLVSAAVIPEPAYTAADYDTLIFQPMYRQIAPLDPRGVLRHEWLNARGAIARFDRGSIELRLLDVQECPAMDLAIVALVSETIRALCEERFTPFTLQRDAPTEALASVLHDTTRDAERAMIREAELLRSLGLPLAPRPAGQVWRYLAERLIPGGCEHAAALQHLLDRGTLATRITSQLGPDPSREALRRVYRRLAECLAANSPWLP